MLEVHQFPCLSDNYGFLIHDPASGETAAIDTPDGVEYLRQAEARGWRITQIWNTHWHPDHAGGNAAIVAATGARVIAPREVERIASIDRVVSDGDTVTLGHWEAQVIDVCALETGGRGVYDMQAGIDPESRKERPISSALGSARLLAHRPCGSPRAGRAAGRAPRRHRRRASTRRP